MLRSRLPPEVRYGTSYLATDFVKLAEDFTGATSRAPYGFASEFLNYANQKNSAEQIYLCQHVHLDI